MPQAGKVAIVTGSSAGIGKEIALAFAREGNKVVVNGRDSAKVASVVEEIHAAGGLAHGVVADVSNKDQAGQLIRESIAIYGRVDILVNNAGGNQGARIVAELEEHDWDAVIAGNLKSVFLCSQAVMPVMKGQSSGKIINISSQAGRALSTLAGAHYAAAKAGVIAFTRHLAAELSSHGIRVNAVAPGVINSGPMVDRVWETLTDEQRQAALNAIPLGRFGTTAEVAATVLFLASDGADYFNGATLDMNGGRWML